MTIGWQFSKFSSFDSFYRLDDWFQNLRRFTSCSPQFSSYLNNTNPPNYCALCIYNLETWRVSWPPWLWLHLHLNKFLIARFVGKRIHWSFLWVALQTQYVFGNFLRYLSCTNSPGYDQWITENLYECLCIQKIPGQTATETQRKFVAGQYSGIPVERAVVPLNNIYHLLSRGK